MPSVSPTTGSTTGPSARPTRDPTVEPSRRSRAPTALPSVEEQEETDKPSSKKQEDTTPYVISASVGGAVCFGLCGLYVLYRRRRRKDKNNKVTTSERRMSRTLSFAESAPPPPVSPSHSHTPGRSPTFRRKRHGSGQEQDWFTSGLGASMSEKSIPVLNSLRARSLSAARSSSFNLSSLHSSERSFEQYLVPDDEDNDLPSFHKPRMVSFDESALESEDEAIEVTNGDGGESPRVNTFIASSDDRSYEMSDTSESSFTH